MRAIKGLGLTVSFFDIWEPEYYSNYDSSAPSGQRRQRFRKNISFGYVEKNGVLVLKIEEGLLVQKYVDVIVEMNGKQILIRAGYDGWRVRLLTSREYARLQGVRDDFILPENANKGYFAMGDAVCVPVIQYLSSNVLTPLFNKWEMNASDKVD